MTTYVLLFLLLDAATGQPLEAGHVDQKVYATLEDCDHAKQELSLQKPKDGKVLVFSCGTEKQVTVF